MHYFTSNTKSDEHLCVEFHQLILFYISFSSVMTSQSAKFTVCELKVRRCRDMSCKIATEWFSAYISYIFTSQISFTFHTRLFVVLKLQVAHDMESFRNVVLDVPFECYLMYILLAVTQAGTEKTITIRSVLSLCTQLQGKAVVDIYLYLCGNLASTRKYFY